MSFIDNDLESIQEARILVETSRDAYQTLKEYDQATLDSMIRLMIPTIRENGEGLIQASFLETGYGKVADEVKLLDQVLTNFESSVLNEKYIGVLEQTKDDEITKVGISLGVAVTQMPAENIVINSIFIALLCLKSGNTCIVIPNERGIKATNHVIDFMKQLLEESGLPKNSLACMYHVSKGGVEEVVNHPATTIILNIGQKNARLITERQAKPIIYGGTGSTPVFIEKTANIEKCCSDIINSRSFNNGILPGAEQYLIVESTIANQVKDELIKNGAHFMSGTEERALIEHVMTNGRDLSPNMVGKTAQELAEISGFSVDDRVRVLVSEQDYILEENPYSEEMKFPILTFYLEPDWKRACEKCINLLEEKRNGHSLVIHSNNQQVINEFALKKPVGRMIVNGPATFSSLGFDSTLPFTFILGGLSMGQGITARNITPKDLTYIRKIGYPVEVESIEEIKEPIDKDDLVQILRKIIKN